MTNADRAIAKRVRMIRFDCQMSVAEFSNVLGLSANKLAGVEYERTPLTVDLADKISSTFDINLIWLAHGRGRMKPCIGLISNICPEIKGNSLLSRSANEVFEAKARDTSILGMVSFAAIMTGRLDARTDAEALKYKEHLLAYFEDLFSSLSLVEKGKLLALLLRIFAKFGGNWALGNSKTTAIDVATHSKKQTQRLTNVSGFDNVSSVKAKLPTLLKRLNEATRERGTKTALAKFMGVPLPNISQWLSGEREPSGETTLQLLHWVEQQEHQK